VRYRPARQPGLYAGPVGRGTWPVGHRPVDRACSDLLTRTARTTGPHATGPRAPAARPSLRTPPPAPAATPR